MTLKEKVLMCELIKANYRRGMFWFYLQVLLILGLNILIVSFYYQLYGLIAILALMAVSVNGACLYLSDTSSGFPWKKKENQVKMLEKIYQKVDFKDIGSYIQLKKYTQV